MGFICTSPAPTPGTSEVETNQSLPRWYQEALRSQIYKASQIANEPYKAFPGERLAGFTPDQLQAFQATRNNVGAFNPQFQSGLSMTQQGAQGWPTANMSSYMNPFQQNVTDLQKREATRQYDIQNNALQASAGAAGAFGGSRHAILEAEGQRNLGQNLADIQSRGDFANWQQAQQAFQQDQARQMQGGAQMASLANVGQSMGLRDAASLQSIGDVQQNQGQRNLDIGYQNFVNQRDFPMQQAQFMSSIIRGLPANSLTSTTQTGMNTPAQPQSSPLAQIAGAGLTAANAIGATGGFQQGGWFRNMFAKGGAVKAPKFAEGGKVSMLEALARNGFDFAEPVPTESLRGIRIAPPGSAVYEDLQRVGRGIRSTAGQAFEGVTNLPNRLLSMVPRRNIERGTAALSGGTRYLTSPDSANERTLRQLEAEGAWPNDTEQTVSDIPEPPAPAPRGEAAVAPPAPRPMPRGQASLAEGGRDEGDRARAAAETAAPRDITLGQLDRMIEEEKATQAAPTPAEPAKEKGIFGSPEMWAAGFRLMAADPGTSFLGAVGKAGQAGMEQGRIEKEAARKERELSQTDRRLSQQDRQFLAELEFKRDDALQRSQDRRYTADQARAARQEALQMQRAIAEMNQGNRQIALAIAKGQLDVAQERADTAREAAADRANQGAGDLIQRMRRDAKLDDPLLSQTMTPQQRAAAEKRIDDTVVANYPRSMVAQNISQLRANSLLNDPGSRARLELLYANKDNPEAHRAFETQMGLIPGTARNMIAAWERSRQTQPQQ